MLQLFFFISYFHKNIRVKSEVYFKSFNILEFGFYKNAKFSIQITNSTTLMVFGLATQKEIKKMNEKRYDIQYCQGKDKMATIQFFVNNSNPFTGNIPKQGILIPFIFSCNNRYTLDLELNYTNFNFHGDYRIQHAVIYTSVFSAVAIIAENWFIIYYKCQDDSQRTNHSLLDIYIISSSIILAMSAIYMYFSCHNEYFDIGLTLGQRIIEILIPIRMLLLILSFLIYYYSSKYIFNISKNIRKNIVFTIAFISVPGPFLIIISNFFKRHFSDWIFYCFPASIYVIMCTLYLIVPSKMTISKLSAMICMIGFSFFFLLDRCFIIENLENKSINFLLVVLNLVSLIVIVVTDALFLIGFIRFHDLNPDNNYNDFAINIPQASYTNLN